MQRTVAPMVDVSKLVPVVARFGADAEIASLETQAYLTHISRDISLAPSWTFRFQL